MRARIAGAIRSVIGDKLPAKFAPAMAFFPEPLRVRSHICIFVHGSADTEAGWRVKPPGLSFGDQILLDFNAQPLYVRYNSGLAIDTSGAELSRLIEAFVKKQKSIRRISLIGHSMGGLVIHAALMRRDGWTKKVNQVFLLGTPHRGAPLAKLAAAGEQILGFLPLPFTRLAATILGLRSAGLKNLSSSDAAKLVLLPKVLYVFIGGGIAKKQLKFMNRVIGDGMVREPSALPDNHSQAKLMRFESIPGVSHLALRNSPETYEAIAKHFRA